VTKYSRAEIEDGAGRVDEIENFEKGDKAVKDQIVDHYSTAAGDSQMFAEWFHELKAEYATDVFLERIRKGEQIPNFRVAGGLVLWRPDQGVGVIRPLRKLLNCSTKLLQNFMTQQFQDISLHQRLQSLLKDSSTLATNGSGSGRVHKSSHDCKRNNHRLMPDPRIQFKFPYPWQI